MISIRRLVSVTVPIVSPTSIPFKQSYEIKLSIKLIYQNKKSSGKKKGDKEKRKEGKEREKRERKREKGERKR
jgi:hypothetical protein